MKKKFIAPLILACSLPLMSCSVYMASQKEGVSPDEIKQCKTRTCLLNKGAVTISQEMNKQEILTEEIFQAKRPSGSSGRAAVHGALDVATLGLWEGVAAPMEGVMNKPDKYGIKVKYKSNGEDIKSIMTG